MSTSKRQPSAEAARAAVELLWVNHHEELVRYVTHRAGDVEADDVVSRVFENTFRVLAEGGGPRHHARGYLFEAARREIIRARERQARWTSFAAVSAARSTDASQSDFSTRELLREILADLSVRDRYLFVQVYAERRSLSSVAEEVDMSAAAASRRLYKIKPKLRSQWFQRQVDLAQLPDSCASVMKNVGAVLADVATEEAQTAFWEHLEGCAACSARVLDVREAARSLAVLLPALGGGATAIAGFPSDAGARGSRRKTALIVGTAVVLAALAVLLGPFLWKPAISQPEKGGSETPTQTQTSQSATIGAGGEPGLEEDGSSQDAAQVTDDTETLPGQNGGSRLDPGRTTCSWSGSTLCHAP